MRILLIIFFALISFAISAKDASPYLQSTAFYQEQYQLHTKPDSTRAHLAGILSYKSLFYNTDSALILANEAIEIANKIKYEPWALAYAYRTIGWLDFVNNNYFNALETYKKAETIAAKFDDHSLLTRIYITNIAQLLCFLDDTEQANEYVKKGLELCHDPFDKIEYNVLALRLINSTKTVSSQTNHQEKLDSLNKLKAAALDLGMDTARFYQNVYHNILLQIADKYDALGDYNKIIDSLQESSCFFEENYVRYRTYADDYFTLIAKAHIALSHLDSAFYFLSKIDSTNISAEQKSSLYEQWSNFYVKKHDYQTAYAFAQMNLNIVDSIFSENLAAKSTEQQLYYKHQLRENEIQNERENFNMKIRIFFYLFGFAIVITIISLVFVYKFRVKNRQLHALNQTKDKIFSIISHDLRSPIVNLIPIFDLLKSQKLSEKQKAIIFDTGTKRIHDVYNLVENLLWWARSQMNGLKPYFENFSIKTLSADIISPLRQIADEKSISISQDIPDLLVFGDQNMFAITLRNLITNAIKFTPNLGSISISASVKDKFCSISVKDTGVGMPLEKLNTIFKEKTNTSTRGTNNEAGSGLGLALCYEFSKQNGGKISARSSLNNGTTFTFTIPLAK